MFRATCDCGKFNVLRSYLVASWISRLCKKCKSHMKVYSDNMLVYDYNNPSERARGRVQGYARLTKNGRILPKLVQLPPPPPPSPIIHDVFMGYHGEPEWVKEWQQIQSEKPVITFNENPEWVREWQQIQSEKPVITFGNPDFRFPFDFDLNN